MQFGPRTLLFVILLLAMPIVAYLLLFKPLNQQKLAAQQDTMQKQEKLTQLSNAMLRTRDITKEIEQLKKAIDLLQNKLPEKKEMDRVLREVSQIAEKNGLNTKSFRILQTVENPNYTEQPIRMMIVGPFNPGFFKFLTDIEQLQRLTRINDMKIEADDKNNGAVTADVTLTIYFDAGQKVAVAQ